MNKTWLPKRAFTAGQTIYSLLQSVKKQHRFIAKHISPILEEAKKTNDGSLDASDFKKITHYYGLAVPAILGDSICVLRGYSMSEKERSALTYQGAMTGLFDDFFDKFEMPEDKLKVFMERPNEIKGNTSAEKLFMIFYKKALEKSQDSSLVSHYLNEVYKAQVESKKQSGHYLTTEEILDITLKKGGVSVLFYRASMSHPFLPGEEKALLEMGGLMQFGNDIFDVYKDQKNEIDTLVTTTKKIRETRIQFSNQMEKSFEMAVNLNYKLNDKKKYLNLILMSLCSRCFVCFDQLAKNELLTDSLFSPSQYTREQLVCDMDKLQNKWRTIKYFIKYLDKKN